MFFWKNKEKFEVKDLYIGVLGYVTKKGESLQIERKDALIIFKREKIDYYDECAKEVLTNQQYYFFHGNFSDSKTIYKAINSLAVFRFLQLSQITKQEFITKEELIELYDNLKKQITTKEETKNNIDECNYPVTDSILQMILETSKKIKDANIDENLKDDILKELEILGEYYINEIINKLDLSNNELVNLTTENEYTIKMNVMKKLVEIEEFSQNSSHTKKYSLKKQLTQFKKDLK